MSEWERFCAEHPEQAEVYRTMAKFEYEAHGGFIGLDWWTSGVDVPKPLFWATAELMTAEEYGWPTFEEAMEAIGG